MRIYRGDLEPDLRLTLTDGDAGPRVDLTGATSVKVIGVRDGAIVLNREATERTADGVVRLEWEAADTATPGAITIEVQVTWPGDRAQTFRPDGVVIVAPDLGD